MPDLSALFLPALHLHLHLQLYGADERTAGVVPVGFGGRAQPAAAGWPPGQVTPSQMILVSSPRIVWRLPPRWRGSNSTQPAPAGWHGRSSHAILRQQSSQHQCLCRVSSFAVCFQCRACRPQE